jgi:hypothetical protein
MVKDHGAQIKDDKTYEELRKKGASKEKAARIANARAAGDQPSRTGGRHGPYEDWNKDRLYQKARTVGIKGRSRMTKTELIDALRTH